MPTIRPAESRDAAAIAALIDRYVPSGALVARSPSYIAERDTDFLVAELDERVVGCVHLREYSPSLAEVRSLAVDPDLGDAGIDAALLDAVERLASRRDYATLFVVTNDAPVFHRRGYEPFEVPEIARERDEVARFAAVLGKELRG